MKTRKLLRALSKQFPKSLCERYDFPGLAAGKLPEEVNKILVCLDFDDEVYPTLLKEKPDMVITHHPFIFGKKRTVLEQDPVKKALFEKIEALGTPIYAYHTNFDTGVGGMNDALANALELENIRQLDTFKMARGGELKAEMEVHEFAKYAKEKLHSDYGLLIAAGKKSVKSVAIVGGGGWREYENARLEGYDIYISGDMPHWARRDVVLRNFNYLDFPHEIERIFIPTMTKILLNIDQTLEVVQVDHEQYPEVI